MTFELILVVLTAVSLLILLWAKYQQSKSFFGKSGDDESVVVEYARSLWPVFVIVLVLRSFVAEPFRIPTGSMYPTLEVGDFIVVNKSAYGLRLPVWYDVGFFDHIGPQRGDVIVFRFPQDINVDYIKRVIGVPGDVIRYYDKQLWINDEQVNVVAPEERYQGQASGTIYNGVSLLTEQLPGSGTIHQMLHDPGIPNRGEFEVTVPEGHYFVMGDNRDHSNDSRFWGFVPKENIKGEALMVWMNWDNGIRFDRMGTSID